ncbi:MAG: response regulator transcription factor [Burkholderiales bacterium]|nr:response regulator transcription factor [Burkholderiales bacterium]
MQTTRPTRVFIVDDSVSIRSRLVQMLARMEDVAVVGEAASAIDAVAGILRILPDSVLLDLNLMGSTGLDVMRKVRPQAPGVVFVVLTNHSEPQYRDACFEAGARYFLDKSRDLDKVAGVIAEIAATRH